MSAAEDLTQHQIVAELDARARQAQGLIDNEFVPQARFIRDESPRKAALCTRRAGKSYGIAADFIADSYHHPGAAYLYLALTRTSAKNIMWEDVLKSINRNFGLNMQPNEAELTMRLPNGCRIALAGADSTKDELEKKLGGKPRKVVVDEAGSFKQDLEKLLIEVLEPAVTDYEGQICMIGTPTELTGSYFHQITSGELDHGWSLHHWNTFQNPHMAEKWAKQIARLKETYGDALEQLPWYRRMYLGEWVTDLESLVYKYDAERNTIDALPEGRYTYLLGIDLGFDDPTAFTLGAYNSYQKTLYIVEAYKRSGMIISDVAERIKYFRDRYDIYDMVIDNASKQAVEELKDRFGLPLEAAEKTGKAEFIEIMNSEFILGKIKLLPGAAPLADEYSSLIWDESKRPKREEHPRCENHLCFVAGTLVDTAHGKKPIEQIKAGEKILTRNGYRKALFAGKTDSRDVITTLFSDGTEITCTPDHPIFTENRGWVRADALLYTDRCVSLPSCENQENTAKLKLRNGTGGYTEDTPIPRTGTSPLTFEAGTATRNARVSYIEMFGPRHTATFHVVGTSTTKMATPPTTQKTTSNVFPLKNIERNTKRTKESEAVLRKIWSCLEKFGQKLRLGIAHLRGADGTVNTVKPSTPPNSGKRGKFHAPNVESLPSSKSTQGKSGISANHIASQNTETLTNSTTKPGHAQTAKPALRLTSTPRSFAVVAPVQVTSGQKRTVYNLQVENTPEYFANGILVHNCDSALYMWRKHLAYMSEPPKPEPKTDEERIDQWEQEEAMAIEASLRQSPFDDHL